MQPIEVIAYSGASGEEEPRAVVIGEVRHEVLEVTDRRREPEGRTIQVLLLDGREIVLFCSDPDLEWYLAETPSLP